MSASQRQQTLIGGAACAEQCPPGYATHAPRRRARPQGDKCNHGALCVLGLLILVVVAAILGLNIFSVVQDQDESRTVSDADLDKVAAQVAWVKEALGDIEQVLHRVDTNPAHGNIATILLALRAHLADLGNGVDDLGADVGKVKNLLVHEHYEHYAHDGGDDYHSDEHYHAHGHHGDDSSSSSDSSDSDASSTTTTAPGGTTTAPTPDDEDDDEESSSSSSSYYGHDDDDAQHHARTVRSEPGRAHMPVAAARRAAEKQRLQQAPAHAAAAASVPRRTGGVAPKPVAAAVAHRVAAAGPRRVAAAGPHHVAGHKTKRSVDGDDGEPYTADSSEYDDSFTGSDSSEDDKDGSYESSESSVVTSLPSESSVSAA